MEMTQSIGAGGPGTNSKLAARKAMRMASNATNNKTQQLMLPPVHNRNGDEITEAESSKVSNQVINSSIYWPLCKMIEEKDWKGVEDFVGRHPKALTDRISFSRMIFHYLIKNNCYDEDGVACLIENLASKVDPITLEQKDKWGWTPLTTCSLTGNTKVAKILVKYNPKLPNIPSRGWFPIHDAASYGYKDLVQYLIQVTEKDKLKGIDGAKLISFLIKSNLYGVALDFLKQYPWIGRDHVSSRNIVLETLAEKPLAFASGSRLGRFQRFIYNCIPANKDPIQTTKNQSVEREGDVENLIVRSKNDSTNPFSFGSIRQMITSTKFGLICKELKRMFWKTLVLLVPCIKVIHEQKVTHMQTVEILRTICEGVVWNDLEVFQTAMWSHTAARFGISEIVKEMLMAYTQSIYWLDNNGCNVFHVAILHRQEKVFNLIYRFRFYKDMLSYFDIHWNNMLHLAARSKPSSEIAGAALQMQRELQWFKAVEDLMRPADREKQNLDKKTPREVFTETHKELVKEGEQWMKGTASSCTVAVALIITVVFAAAFTVPGGNNDNGVPIFLKDQAFLIFAVSDALALVSSTTSLLTFLGILTSRYAEEDFLESLPRKLIIGLLTLFFSVACMMVAFGATIYTVLSHPWKLVIIPIVLLGCAPVTLFALLQFPLLLDIILSTYGPSIFGPNK